MEIRVREATVADVPAIVACRAADAVAGPADPRIAAYLRGEHHPQHALPARVLLVAHDGGAVVGYIGGHLTKRFACDGELQYLYVVADRRRLGVATTLVGLLAGWFADHDAPRVCVDVAPDNAGARAFYARRGAVPLNRAWMVWNDISAACDARAR